MDCFRGTGVETSLDAARKSACATLWLVLLAGVAFGQTFEFADVHASAPSTNPTMRGGSVRGGRYEVRTATMVDLIGAAYDMEPDKILGGPSWLDWDRFDVTAKAPQANVNAMLQNLLKERFQLTFHKDIKPMPAFVLDDGKR